MGLGSTTKVPVPQSLKSKNWQEWISDLRGTTSPCDRVQFEILNSLLVHGSVLSPEHKPFYVDCMKSNKKYRDLYHKSDGGLTPLIYIAAKVRPGIISDEQAVDIVQMFIEGGIDLNAQCDDFGTSLDSAIAGHHWSLVKALVLAGATTYTKTDMNHFGNILKGRAESEKNKELYTFDPEHPTQHQDMLIFFNKNMARVK